MLKKVTEAKISKPELILIDLDGTLVDSVPDLANATDHMMAALDMPLRGEAMVREWIGNGVPRLICRALTASLDGEPDKALYDRAYPIFIDYYKEHVCDDSRLYPGVQEGIDYFLSKGYTLGCVTNKAKAFTVPLLKKLGIHDCFKVIVSGDTLDKKKPDPAPLLYAAEQCGVHADHSLMIGDSMHDVDAARAAKFKVVCVSYGYNHGVDIASANPDAVIDSFTELQDLIG